jgi:hypothetical protein
MAHYKGAQESHVPTSKFFSTPYRTSSNLYVKNLRFLHLFVIFNYLITVNAILNQIQIELQGLHVI